MGPAVLQVVRPQIRAAGFHSPCGTRYHGCMPLSATVGDELLCAPLVDPVTWAGLRGKQIRLQPCGHRGFPRVSALGTQHFVHARDCGCEHAESAEHLRMKAVVAAAVAQAGWEAATEVPGPGFVADVVATHGPSAVAFEVQRSRQVLREYERRQATYAAAGIRCVWLVADVPAGHRAGPGLPLFRITDWMAHRPLAMVAGRTRAVPELVTALLSGACRWCEDVGGRSVRYETLRQVCPLCGCEREVEIARWTAGGCECGLPVVRSGQGIAWPAGGTCCGYWGEWITLGMRSRQESCTARVPAGHWCFNG